MICKVSYLLMNKGLRQIICHVTTKCFHYIYIIKISSFNNNKKKEEEEEEEEDGITF